MQFGESASRAPFKDIRLRSHARDCPLVSEHFPCHFSLVEFLPLEKTTRFAWFVGWGNLEQLFRIAGTKRVFSSSLDGPSIRFRFFACKLLPELLRCDKRPVTVYRSGRECVRPLVAAQFPGRNLLGARERFDAFRMSSGPAIGNSILLTDTYRPPSRRQRGTQTFM